MTFDGRSIIEQLSPHVWSAQDAVGFEAALEAAQSLIAAYSALIVQEESKPCPDPGVIERWLQERRLLIQGRDALNADQPEEIAEARRRFIERLAEVEQELS
jgi:hypothetical protein